jgi:hypothetical protein
MLAPALSTARATVEYYVALLYCLARPCNISAVPLLQHDTGALVHVYSLAKTLQLWHAPHYRAPTFADDLRANLKNVAMPGTGACRQGCWGRRGACGRGAAEWPCQQAGEPERRAAAACAIRALRAGSGR